MNRKIKTILPARFVQRATAASSASASEGSLVQWLSERIWNRDRMVHTRSYRYVLVHSMLGYHTPIYHYKQVHTFCHKYVLGPVTGSYFLPQVCTWYIQVHTRRKRYIIEGKSTYLGLKVHTFPVIYQHVPVHTLVLNIVLHFLYYVLFCNAHSTLGNTCAMNSRRIMNMKDDLSRG